MPGQIRALIVDDNAYARSVTAASLRRIGIGEIVEADGGVMALGLMAEQRFDVLLLDWYMSEISGAGLLQVVRQGRVARTAKLPVVVITAYASRDNLDRARVLGASEVLTKPFTSDHLGTVLRRVLPSGWDVPPEGDGEAESETHFL